MAMQTTGSNEAGEPMMEINTTPLIDVILVLLIMFIISIPTSPTRQLDLPQYSMHRNPSTRSITSCDHPPARSGGTHPVHSVQCGIPLCSHR